MKNCRNCGLLINDNANYCEGCGQKCTDGKIALKDIGRDFVENFFNFDAKFFKTLAHLFIPGKLTEAYFEGKHKSYLSPIRLLLAVLLLFVIGITSVVKQQDLNLNNSIVKWQKEQAKYELLLKADTLKTSMLDSLDSSIAVKAVDDYYESIQTLSENYSDSMSLSTTAIQFNYDSENQSKSYRIAKKDILEMKDAELVEAYLPDATFMQKFSFKQGLRFFKNTNDLPQYALGKVSWLMLINIPLFAFFLKLLYVRRKHYYVEHLIFGIHVHTFIFLIFLFQLLLLGLLPKWFGVEWNIQGLVNTVSVILLLLYIPLSMKRFYKQKWGKTILKFFIGGFFYWLIFVASIVITTLISFALY